MAFFSFYLLSSESLNKTGPLSSNKKNQGGPELQTKQAKSTSLSQNERNSGTSQRAFLIDLIWAVRRQRQRRRRRHVSAAAAAANHRSTFPPHPIFFSGIKLIDQMFELLTFLTNEQVLPDN